MNMVALNEATGDAYTVRARRRAQSRPTQFEGLKLQNRPSSLTRLISRQTWYTLRSWAQLGRCAWVAGGNRSIE